MSDNVAQESVLGIDSTDVDISRKSKILAYYKYKICRSLICSEEHRKVTSFPFGCSYSTLVYSAGSLSCGSDNRNSLITEQEIY